MYSSNFDALGPDSLDNVISMWILELRRNGENKKKLKALVYAMIYYVCYLTILLIIFQYLTCTLLLMPAMILSCERLASRMLIARERGIEKDLEGHQLLRYNKNTLDLVRLSFY